MIPPKPRKPREERAFAPHCDQRVLHAPGECAACDHYPDWQQGREVQGINFTGHYDADKQPCPASVTRSVEKINRWSGNRPTNLENPDQAYYDNLNRVIESLS